MRRCGGLLGLTLALALVAAACGGDDDSGTTGGGGTQLSGTINIDGSSTVAPLSEAAAELFQEQNSGVRVTVGTSGTGGGFEKFCAGETDISDASRAIEDDEKQACQSKGIKYEEVQVANDGLSVVVNPQNNWAKCLTVAQLKKIWDKGSKVNNWNQVDPSFPNEPLKLFGAGTDSGTFDYFTKAINGEEGRSRSDYSATEDDNVTVTGVSGTKGGLGYFGLSYLQENEGKIQGVQVDGGGGCVAPTVDTVQDGSYTPLSRPLFIYPSDKALERPEVKAFLEYYVNNYQKIAEDALFVPLTDEQAVEAKGKIAQLAAS
ncbi:MAG TPA: PstS family phosphate ABC transporter substrate-binding protein [Actinomycetes bacterium]|jgi:phosphate transport system substrate-binding protein|nr:PstS family phosphate ABC transporter substrate-binding protein [Actinomycetes bacterium]